MAAREKVAANTPESLAMEHVAHALLPHVAERLHPPVRHAAEVRLAVPREEGVQPWRQARAAREEPARVHPARRQADLFRGDAERIDERGRGGEAVARAEGAHLGRELAV